MSIWITFSKFYENAIAVNDFYAAEDKIIKSCGRELIKLDLQVVIPDGFYGRIVGRSDWVPKCEMLVGSGTINSDYLGVVYVILFNFSNVEYQIKKCNRIA